MTEHWTQTPMLAQMAGLLLVGINCIGLVVWQQLTGEIWVQAPWDLRRRRLRRKESPWRFWSGQALAAAVALVSFGLLAWLISLAMSQTA